MTDDNDGYAVPIRISGTLPLLVLGAPRKFTILNSFSAVFFVIQLWTWEFLIVSAVLQVSIALIYKKEPEFFQLLWQYYRTSKTKYYEG